MHVCRFPRSLIENYAGSRLDSSRSSTPHRQRLPPKMSYPISPALRNCSRALRPSSRPSIALSSTPFLHQRRIPTPPFHLRHESTAASTNPKITTIVDQISQLTLLETADLVSHLKVPNPDPHPPIHPPLTHQSPNSTSPTSHSPRSPPAAPAPAHPPPRPSRKKKPRPPQRRRRSSR